MARKDEYRVHPTDYENFPAEQIYPLSDIDHAVMKAYIQIALVFELPAEADKSKIISSLKAGLEVTLSQYPALAGTLQMNAENGKLWVLRERESTVGFTVNWIDGPEDDFPSYEALNKADFSASSIDGNALLPATVTSSQVVVPVNDGPDVFTTVFQANMIRGGLILCLAVHHSCSDGPGCNGFLTQWSENSKAIVTGTPLRPFDPINLDRSQLTSSSIPDQARMEELSKKIPVFKHIKEAPPAPPAGFVMPEMLPVMWHFPKSSCEKLKSDAQPEEKDAWISTYDSIMAILWKTITRSRIPMHHPDLAKEVILLHAVNNRTKVDPPLPNRYLGNAISLATTKNTTLASILAEGSLPKLASSIRTSILEINPKSISETVEWVAGTENKAWIGAVVNFFLGLDLSGTSWQTMSAYTDQDFGFGLPKALRFPKPALDGFVFVYPHRPKKDELDEGIEVCVCLEKGCQERLMEDEELKAYAYPRGV